MNYEIKLIGELPPETQSMVAHHISDYTKGMHGEKPQMLPVEPADIANKFAGAVALLNELPVGYIGASIPTENKTEIGTLVVDKEHRHNGLAHALVAFMTNHVVVQEIQPYAFCNLKSLGIFVDSGYSTAQSGTIPACAFELCATCPAKTKKPDTCCDTIVLFNGEN